MFSFEICLDFKRIIHLSKATTTVRNMEVLEKYIVNRHINMLLLSLQILKVLGPIDASARNGDFSMKPDCFGVQPKKFPQKFHLNLNQTIREKLSAILRLFPDEFGSIQEINPLGNGHPDFL